MSARQDGFTLIEMMVALLISTIVMLSTFQALDAFSSNTARQTRANDANDQVRTLMERTVKDLRSAATISYAGPQDLIYTVQEPAGTRTSRICVSGGRLYGWSTVAPATAPTSATPCANGTSVATVKSSSSTGFTYDGASSSSSPQAVRNVGLTFALYTTYKGKTTPSI